MKSTDRAFNGIWIPAEIWESPILTLMEKCLIAEIDSLDKGDGCWAGNDFLAERLQTTKGNVANTVSKLRALGMVETVKSDGRSRWLKVVKEAKSGLIQTSPVSELSVHAQMNVDSLVAYRDDDCCIEGENNEDSVCESKNIKPPSVEKSLNSQEDPNSKESLALALYKSYPRKVGKNAALKAILKAMKDHSFDYLLERVARYAECTRSWPEDQTQFIPHPATWFNGGRFEDEESNWIRKASVETFPQLSQKAFALRTAIQEHVANREYIGAVDNPTQEQFADLRSLRSQLSEVESKMASIRK
jgi:hypothetical protein